MVGRTEKWIATMIDGLNNHVDEKARDADTGTVWKGMSVAKIHRESQKNLREIEEH